MSAIWAAHLRFHWRITPRQWKEMKLTEEEIFEWYYEFFFIKEQLGEIEEKPKK